MRQAWLWGRAREKGRWLGNAEPDSKARLSETCRPYIPSAAISTPGGYEIKYLSCEAKRPKHATSSIEAKVGGLGVARALAVVA